MMGHANLPISFWGDALLMAAYILNCIPSKSVTATSYELWYGRKLSLHHLCLWGLIDYVHNITNKHEQLGPKANKMVFIRYPAHFKGM